MTETIVKIADVRWYNPEQTELECQVTFDTFPFPIHFVAIKDGGTRKHEQALWNQIMINSDDIAPYVAPIKMSSVYGGSAPQGRPV